MSWFLQVAIEQALTIISWFENCTKEEVPPEHLWEDSEGLEQWWATVKEKRDGDLPSSSGSSRASDLDGDGDDKDPEPGMAENDLARILKDG